VTDCLPAAIAFKGAAFAATAFRIADPSMATGGGELDIVVVVSTCGFRNETTGKGLVAIGVVTCVFFSTTVEAVRGTDVLLACSMVAEPTVVAWLP